MRRYSTGWLIATGVTLLAPIPMSGALMAISLEGDLVKVPSLRIVQMHGAGQARVKGMDGAQNLDRFVDLCHRRADQRLLEGRALLFGVARRAVPGGWDYELIVRDRPVVDLDVVRQRASGSLGEANALYILRPRLRLPEFAIEGGNLVDLHPLHQLSVELLQPAHRQRAIQSTRRDPAQRGEERAHGHVQLAQGVAHQSLHVVVPSRIRDDQPRQGADLHRLFLPAWRLQE